MLRDKKRSKQRYKCKKCRGYFGQGNHKKKNIEKKKEPNVTLFEIRMGFRL